MPRQAASKTAITRHPFPMVGGEPVFGKWPIDRTRSPESKLMSRQMAEAIIHLRKQGGAVTEQMLLTVGFTVVEIHAHGREARVKAVHLAPQLAHEYDHAFAELVKKRRVA